MPTKESNLQVWSDYYWSDGGDEWSAYWGNSESLWWGTIFPRIQPFLPVKYILEIAPGYGRCTQFLYKQCDRLFAVDITQKCVDFCRHRFVSVDAVNFFVNDGMRLDMIADNSIDFVFSWDSLVHVDAVVMESYVHELSKKLSENGVGFIHHSNLGSIGDKEVVDNSAWRDTTMTADLFKKFCSEAGLKCISQELIYWNQELFTDCFSVFCRQGSSYDKEFTFYKNCYFMKERDNLRNLNMLYGRTSDISVNADEVVDIEGFAAEINQLVRELKYISTVRPVGVWGASERGRMIKRILNLADIKVCAFIDANSSIEGSEIDGLNIHRVDWLLGIKEKPYVIVGSGRIYEIQKQLIDFGFNEQDYSFAFSKINLNDNSFDRIISRLKSMWKND